MLLVSRRENEWNARLDQLVCNCMGHFVVEVDVYDGHKRSDNPRAIRFERFF